MLGAQHWKANWLAKQLYAALSQVSVLSIRILLDASEVNDGKLWLAVTASYKATPTGRRRKYELISLQEVVRDTSITWGLCRPGWHAIHCHETGWSWNCSNPRHCQGHREEKDGIHDCTERHNGHDGNWRSPKTVDRRVVDLKKDGLMRGKNGGPGIIRQGCRSRRNPASRTPWSRDQLQGE